MFYYVFSSRVTLFFYFLGCVLFLLNLWDRRVTTAARGVAAPGLDPPRSIKEGFLAIPMSQRLALLMTGVGFISHSLALVIRLTTDLPFSDPKEAISFFSWVLVLIFFRVDLRYQVYVMGSFILPVVLLSLLFAAALPYPSAPVLPTVQNALLGVHTTLSLIGIAAFAIAFVVGIMYLLQEGFLKSKRSHPLYEKLPSLELLDRWNETALFWGFPLLTLGMIAGAVWSEYALGSLMLINHPKMVFSIGVWFFYLIVLQGRLMVGWRARRAARLAIAGFIGVLFIFFTLV